MALREPGGMVDHREKRGNQPYPQKERGGGGGYVAGITKGPPARIMMEYWKRRDCEPGTCLQSKALEIANLHQQRSSVNTTSILDLKVGNISSRMNMDLS